MRARRPLSILFVSLAMAILLSGCLGLFPKRATVIGTVAFSDGRPAANASVKLGSLTTVADKNGAFTFNDVEYDTYSIKVLIDGVERYSGKVVIDEKEKAVKITIPLQRGNVSGTVAWDDGMIIADALIQLGDELAGSNENGEYYFNDVPYGEHPILVSLDGVRIYAGAVIVDKSEHIEDITVSRTLRHATIFGRVTWADGTPAVGADVTLGDATAMVDAEGGFAFSEVLYGQYYVDVVLGHTNVYSDTVKVDAEEVQLNITLNWASVSGVVKYDDGSVIPDAIVRLGEFTAETDANGVFEFASVPYGLTDYSVTVDDDIVLSGELAVTQSSVPWDLVVPRPPVIVYGVQVDGKWQVFRSYADGTDETQLTFGDLENWYPRLSPDGTQIVFESYRERNRNIYVMSVDGGEATRVTSPATQDRHAAWSPDGSRLVFHSKGSDHNNFQLYTMRADGTDLRRLTYSNQTDAWGSFSPDGQRIVFGSNRDGNYELFMINVDGSGEKKITSNGVDNRNPVWSPDGTMIAFASRLGGNDHEICILDLDDMSTNCITDNSDTDGFPDWSSDGSQIVFTSDRDGVVSMYMMNVDGSNVRRISGGTLPTGYGPF